jgi:hypothetical protein
LDGCFVIAFAWLDTRERYGQGEGISLSLDDVYITYLTIETDGNLALGRKGLCSAGDGN